jgi:hypothetical protein
MVWFTVQHPNPLLYLKHKQVDMSSDPDVTHVKTSPSVEELQHRVDMQLGKLQAYANALKDGVVLEFGDTKKHTCTIMAMIGVSKPVKIELIGTATTADIFCEMHELTNAPAYCMKLQKGAEVVPLEFVWSPETCKDTDVNLFFIDIPGEGIPLQEHEHCAHPHYF